VSAPGDITAPLAHHTRGAVAMLLALLAVVALLLGITQTLFENADHC
jgi:hypothetical protein